MKKILDITYYKDQKLDIYVPEKKDFTTIVYFHGGGISCGDKGNECYVGIAEDFVKNGYGFVSCNYSMYPSAKFPDYLIDCAKATKYVIDNIKNYGGSDKIIISGQSAGAWISLMLCLNKEYLFNEGVDSQSIFAWIIDSAQTTSHFNVIEKELKLDCRRQLINEYAPLYFLDENTAFSKMLLIYYENDMPCRPQQNRLFFTAVKYFNDKANIEIKELKGSHCHGSTVLDEDGRYEYVKVALDWLNK